MNRPGTLREAVGPAEAGPDAAPIHIRIAEFLDEFYMDGDPRSRLGRVAGEPRRVGDPRADAMVGAIGEHLCHRWALGAPPPWTDRGFRFLSEPWYPGDESMRRFHFVESPSAFRRRFIFTEAEPLRRARMPRDGRWWAYEELRSGMRPNGPGDVAPPSAPPG